MCDTPSIATLIARNRDEFLSSTAENQSRGGSSLLTAVRAVAGGLAPLVKLLVSEHLQAEDVLEKGHGLLQAPDFENLSSKVEARWVHEVMGGGDRNWKLECTVRRQGRFAARLRAVGSHVERRFEEKQTLSFCKCFHECNGNKSHSAAAGQARPQANE